MVIYLDVLLALNLFIDFLLLEATARVLHLPVRRGRLIAGALVGAASACIVFLPTLPAVALLVCKLLCAAVMVRVAFVWRGTALYVKQSALLFLISALFAGICFGLWYFVAPDGFMVVNGVVYYDVPPLMLVLLTLISYGGICLYERLTRKRVAVNCAYRLWLDTEQGEVSLRTLLDTGHSVCDSFSGAPVILVRRCAVEPVLSPAIAAAIDHPESLSAAVRYIPYSSLGGGGMLVAFRPERVRLSGSGQTADIGGVWVAVVDALGRGEYEALIGPDAAALLHTSLKPPIGSIHHV